MSWIDRLLDGDADRESVRSALLEHSEELAQVGSWAWDPDRGQLVWSDNFYRLLGLAPGEVEPSPEYVLARAHPDDQARLAEMIEARRAGRETPTAAIRVLTADDTIRHLENSVVLNRRPQGRRLVVGVVRDVTERREAEREIAAHVAVAEALSQWQSFRPGAGLLLCRLAEALGCGRALLWVIGDGFLYPTVGWARAGYGDPLAELSDVRLAPGEGFVGRAWIEREPLSAASLEQERDLAYSESVRRYGLRGALAMPAVNGDEVLAVVSCAAKTSLPMTERLRGTLSGISHELGQFLARRRSELRPPTLTGREREILQLAANGASGPEIATLLSVSPATVKSHFDNIYRKYDVGDRAAAVAKAMREGLIQ